MSDSAAERLLRELAPQVLGALTRRVGDFSAAEDAVQEALLAAAMQWPKDGVPDNPGGWLFQVASRRMADHVRSEQARRRREAIAVGQTPPHEQQVPAADSGDATEQDDTLILLFMCCHPALTPPSAIALTLRAVGGLTTAEIAGALLKRMSDNPMVALNHAIAAAMVHGPSTGLELLKALDADERVAGHYRLDAVRAHLLELAGNHPAAIAHYRAAASRTTSLPERHYLVTKASRLAAAT